MRTILLPLVILAVILGAILVFRPTTNSSQTNHPVKSFSYLLSGKQKINGPDTITVTQGDNVQISVTADKNWPELHIHGYELHLPIVANKPETESFTADKTGTFLVEVHFSDTDDADALTLGQLQVYPK